jgi:hypothetical protein
VASAKLTEIDRGYAKRDAHPVIEAWKARCRGKPRGSLWPLHHQRTLGVCLLALGRVDEALAVLDEAARSVRWSGKPSPWVIGSWCAATAHWARLQRGETPAVAALTRFGEHDGHAAIRLQPELWTTTRFADEIADGWTKFEAGRANPGYLGVDTMAFHLSCIAFYRLLHLIAPVHRGKVKAARTDARLAKALRAIEDRIARTTQVRT